MTFNKDQIQAEHAVHQQLEAGDIDMLAEFADFAAGEIDSNHTGALLLAILLADSSRWAFMLANVRQYSPDLAEAIDKLENELERKRAKFIERHAAVMVKELEAIQDAAAAYGKEH